MHKDNITKFVNVNEDYRSVYVYASMMEGIFL